MKFTRSLDVSFAIALALVMVTLVLIKGDPLYIGVWYYIAVPAITLGLCSTFRPAPLFLSGVASAITLSMLALMSINWSAERPEGLLGLGHVFSLPFAIIVVLGSAFFIRKKQISRPHTAFLVGLIGFGGGYFVNQLLVCNTLMWCGSLSLPIK